VIELQDSAVRVLAMLALSAFAHPAHAQIGYLWQFDELLAKADLVVIAEHVETNEAGRLTDHPALKPATPADRQSPLPAVQLTSDFTVLGVVKPEAPAAPSAGARIRLTHYRIDWDEWRRLNPPEPGMPPPGLVNTGSVLDFSRNPGPFLLFLTRGEDGGYEPLSGHTFPTRSVYSLRNMAR
jgi:hypothetical protein